VDVTAEERNDSVVCRTDGGGMSQDVFPIQIRVTVFILTRLCANAEIGVHRGRIASLRHSCSSLRHSCSSLRHSCSSLRHSCSSLPSFLLLPPVIPAPPSRHSCSSLPSFLLLPPSFLLLPPVIPAPPSRHSCSSLRHSCEGRNLNQDVDVPRHTSP